MKKSVSFATTVTKIPHVLDQYPDSHRSETPIIEEIVVEKKEEAKIEKQEDEDKEENNGYVFYSVLTIVLIASIAAGVNIYKNIKNKFYIYFWCVKTG